MGIDIGAFGVGRNGRGLALRALLFVLWLGAVLFMTSRHVYWRDEVRALSLALQGDGVGEMLVRLRGEGHPALWYVLLRLGHAVVPSAAVLSVVALTAIVPGAALLTFASPFPPWLIGALLGSGALLFEYSVMARNYGLAVSLMFAMAAGYRRWRRGPWLGLLAALLANTNAHSALLAGGFMLMWLLDMRGGGWRWWAVNAAVAAAGVLGSAWTLYPPVNDAVLAAPGPIAAALLLPATQFGAVTVFSWSRVFGIDWLAQDPGPVIVTMSAVLFGTAAGLSRWWPGVAAALATLLALSAFFALVYPGDYRHAGLWLAFVTGLYWIGWRERSGLASRIGSACFAGLILLQVPAGMAALAAAATGAPPLSQVRNLARALQARPDLRDAVLIPDPDELLEAFPAYGDNLIYLPRSRRFGRVAPFTRREPTGLSLKEMLTEAQSICRARDVPVVLVLAQNLRSAALPHTFVESYALSFTATPSAFRALEASTEYLGRFAPSRLREDFSAYALLPPCLVAWSG